MAQQIGFKRNNDNNYCIRGVPISEALQFFWGVKYTQNNENVAIKKAVRVASLDRAILHVALSHEVKKKVMNRIITYLLGSLESFLIQELDRKNHNIFYIF